ncbi:MAG: hypothetical protein HRF49_01220 [bacterium]|jgi:hypothetical protein
MYDESAMRDICAAFEGAVLRWPLADTRKMFGCPCYLAADKMFAFLVTGGVVLTCTNPEMRERLAAKFGARPFSSGGKKIGGWMECPVSGEGDLEKLLPFALESFNAALEKAG